MDKKSGRNDRNEILKRKFDEPKAEADGTSRLLRSKQKQKTTIPKLIGELLAKAGASVRLRQNLDLRTSGADGSQRMLNALLPGTRVPIHRHPESTENVLILTGKLAEIFYEEEVLGDGFERGMDAQNVLRDRRFREIDRVVLDAAAGRFGCVVPAGVWHTVEVLEPSVIYEAKDGKYGADGSEQG